MMTGSGFWFVLSACIGGLIVLVGLLMETLADKKRIASIAAFRLWESVKKWGEWLVIFGVLIETVVAGWTAKYEWQNDSKEKPIASASARARIIFKLSEKQTGRQLLAPFFKPGSDDVMGWTAWVNFKKGNRPLLQLTASASDFAIWNMGSDIEKECRILLKEDPFNFLQAEADRNAVLVKDFSDADSFIMFVSELPTNVVVVSGNLYLAVNDSKWTFEIPPQKPKFGLITMHQTKINVGKVKSEIVRVPLTDWLYPPRFTNFWYDGK